MSISFLKKIARVIRPQVEVGGLEITDTGVLFFSVHPETKKTKQFSVSLEAGVVYEGKVKNNELLIRSLKQLHGMINGHKKDSIPVIVTLSNANVFTQVFTLPKSIGSAFREAVRLNMQTLSPIDFLKSYSDWERTEDHPDSSDAEVIASFVDQSIIDPFIFCLEQGGFSVVAIEQRSVSLTRFVLKNERSFSPEKSYILLHVNGDGITIAVACRGHLYFDKFSSWETIMKETHAAKEIIFDDFASLLIREAHQVSNFFISRSQSPIAGLYVIAGSMNDRIIGAMNNKLPFPVYPLSLAHQPADESWFVSVGAALRGLIPRANDAFISLAPEGTQDMLVHEQVISFIASWRTMFLVVGLTLMLAFVGVYTFLGQVSGSIAQDLQSSVTPASVVRYNELKKEAVSFNDAVARALVVQAQQTRWSSFLNDLYAQAGPMIRIERIYVQGQDSTITINARTNNEDSAIAFKRQIEQLSSVTDVDLPLTSISQADQNTITFKVTLKRK